MGIKSKLRSVGGFIKRHKKATALVAGGAAVAGGLATGTLTPDMAQVAAQGAVTLAAEHPNETYLATGIAAGAGGTKAVGKARRGIHTLRSGLRTAKTLATEAGGALKGAIKRGGEQPSATEQPSINWKKAQWFIKEK